VCKAGENVNKVSEDKIIKKMENALKNREEYYRALQAIHFIQFYLDFNSTSIHTTKKHVDKTNSRYYLDVKAYYYVFTL
jgi:hypothetical protein